MISVGGGRPARVLGLLALALVAICFMSLSSGLGDAERALLVLQIRLPRLVLAILVGAGLAVSGAVLQSVSANDLASPDTLGVNAGAGLGMMFLIAAIPTAAAQWSLLLPLGAVLGAVPVTAFVFLWAYDRGTILPAKLLLVGVAAGMGAYAAMLLLAMRMSFVDYRYALTWLSGTLAGSDWASVLLVLPWMVILVPLAFSRARTLDVLSLGKGAATGLGVSVERQRLLLLSGAALLTSACTAVGGHIGFLGLVAPHIARRLTGERHVVLLPVACLCGATLLLLADRLARSLPFAAELPAGVIVSVLGGTYFLWLLVSPKRGWSWQ